MDRQVHREDDQPPDRQLAAVAAAAGGSLVRIRQKRLVEDLVAADIQGGEAVAVAVVVRTAGKMPVAFFVALKVLLLREGRMLG